MLLLYAVPHSLYCAKTRILLRHKGLDWQEDTPTGGASSDAYRERVPSGNLPALVHGDLILSDSEAIAEYIEEAFPDPPMMPEQLDARAKTRERSRFHDTRLEPALRQLFPIVKAGGTDREAIESAADAITARLNQLARMLDDPLAPSDRFTLGDCGLPVSFDWIDAICGALKQPIEWPERVLAYRRWLDTIPAVTTEMEIYHPVMRGWVEGALG